MRYAHCIILATNCRAAMTRMQVVQLLDSLQPPTGVLDRKVVERKNGLVGYYVTDHEHLIITTNPAVHEAFLDIRSRRPIDQNRLISAFQQFADTHFSNILAREFTNNDYSRVECQEAHCTRPATRDYNGLKICEDHYQQWQEKEATEEKRTEYY